MRPHRRPPTRLFCPWGFPGKNAGVGCHCLLQCMKVESESEVAQSCPTLSDPMDCSLPGSSVHGIFQERVLEWGAIAFSMDFTSFYLMSFFCSGIPSRMWHYMWSSGLFWLFLAMIFSHASHAFDDFSFEEYWLSILFNGLEISASSVFASNKNFLGGQVIKILRSLT